MQAWKLIKGSVLAFINDGALSQGAAIAFYTIFSIAPVLLIVIAIAGLVFGRDAAKGEIVRELGGMMGTQSLDTLQSMINGASNKKSGIIATLVGAGTLLVAASGVFGQMQTALNMIWRAHPGVADIRSLVKARMVSLGLVMAMGFLLLASLALSAGLAALQHDINGLLPGVDVLIRILNFIISFALVSVLFGAIYKVLPDTQITWRDVAVGAMGTAFLFTVGKSLIALYIGRSDIASSYGAAGAFVVILLWIYYSSQIFLLGAEFTKVYANTHGSHASAGAASPGDQIMGSRADEP
jgi:membrane protein